MRYRLCHGLLQESGPRPGMVLRERWSRARKVLWRELGGPKRWFQLPAQLGPRSVGSSSVKVPTRWLQSSVGPDALVPAQLGPEALVQGQFGSRRVGSSSVWVPKRWFQLSWVPKCWFQLIADPEALVPAPFGSRRVGSSSVYCGNVLRAL